MNKKVVSSTTFCNHFPDNLVSSDLVCGINSKFLYFRDNSLKCDLVVGSYGRCHQLLYPYLQTQGSCARYGQAFCSCSRMACQGSEDSLWQSGLHHNNDNNEQNLLCSHEHSDLFCYTCGTFHDSYCNHLCHPRPVHQAESTPQQSVQAGYICNICFPNSFLICNKKIDELKRKSVFLYFYSEHKNLLHFIWEENFLRNVLWRVMLNYFNLRQSYGTFIDKSKPVFQFQKKYVFNSLSTIIST